jgi:hypothetical protein
MFFDMRRRIGNAEQQEEKIGEAFEAKAEERANRLLLDLVMPNEKRLRDCTCAECKQMRGWLTKLARKGRPDQLIGDVVSEAEVREIAPGYCCEGA